MAALSTILMLLLSSKGSRIVPVVSTLPRTLRFIEGAHIRLYVKADAYAYVEQEPEP